MFWFRDVCVGKNSTFDLDCSCLQLCTTERSVLTLSRKETRYLDALQRYIRKLDIDRKY